MVTEEEDPDLEPGEDLVEEDLAAVVDPMLDDDIDPGEAEGVTEEAEISNSKESL